MVRAVFDTNILIDYLNGEIKSKQEIEKYQQIAISIISYIEVMVGVDDTNKKTVIEFLHNFQILNFDETMTDKITHIRTTLKIKLPDAIILATAITNQAVLVTRNTKDFPLNNKNIVIPYTVI